MNNIFCCCHVSSNGPDVFCLENEPFQQNAFYMNELICWVLYILCNKRIVITFHTDVGWMICVIILKVIAFSPFFIRMFFAAFAVNENKIMCGFPHLMLIVNGNRKHCVLRILAIMSYNVQKIQFFILVMELIIILTSMYDLLIAFGYFLRGYIYGPIWLVLSWNIEI